MIVPNLNDVHRRIIVGQGPLILHEPRYLISFQETVQEFDELGVNPCLVGAAAECAHFHVTNLFIEKGLTNVPERLKLTAEFYKWMGHGTLDLTSTNHEGGTLTLSDNLHSVLWREYKGNSKTPVDFFTTGWLAGALAAIYNAPLGSFDARQVKCIAVGDKASEFNVKRGRPGYDIYRGVGVGDMGPMNDRPVKGPVEIEDVYKKFVTTFTQGDTVDLSLGRFHANYYNRITYEVLDKLSRRYGKEGFLMGQKKFLEAGEQCAYFTLGKIMKSAYWEEASKELESKKDWIFAMVAVLNGMGMGQFFVRDTSSTGARFAVYNDFESIGHLEMSGRSDHDVAFLTRSMVKVLMDLIYRGDIEGRPDLTIEACKSLLKTDSAFKTKVRKSRACGDEFTEIEVIR